MIEVKPYKREYLKKIELQDIQKDDVEFFKADEKKSFVLLDGDMILAVISVREIYKGRAEVVSLVSKACGKKLLYMVRVLRKILSDYMEKSAMDRVECTVVSGFDNGDRFVSLLGFEYEGTMRKAIFGNDYKLFSRVRY